MENQIDFPCSPTFASHYAREGLTPELSIDYHLLPLQERLQRLEDVVFGEGSISHRKNDLPAPGEARQIQELRALVLHLEAKLNYHLDKKPQRKSILRGIEI